MLEALEQHPRRIDSPLVFPGHDGDHLKQVTFRMRHWAPALRAAGVEHRGVYACRHTFAAWSIAAGVQLFYLSRIMGTSVTHINQTYGHLVPDSEEYVRGLLDDYDLVLTRTAVEGAGGVAGPIQTASAGLEVFAPVVTDRRDEQVQPTRLRARLPVV